MKNASDVFEIPHVPGLTDIDTGNPHVPPMLVINATLPADEPSLFGPSTTDGPSYIIVMYFVLAKHTLEQLKDLEHASPAVRLLVEWCRRSETDDTFRGRFKCMGVVEDIEKTKIPSFIQGYNGKPALVQKSGKYRRYGNYAEAWVNIHGWSFACKKGLAALRPKFPDFILNTGFTIEARDDEELPEVLLAGVRVIHLDPTQAKAIPTTTVMGQQNLPYQPQLRERADTY
uniref:Protein ENHANCED DISEASE RESISTANCE 2 C-terminal domain-containing protein n=1 Tax=Attheya septentrionalis TaxID=420275 RepID=A0A7S2U9P4_9STRA